MPHGRVFILKESQKLMGELQCIGRLRTNIEISLMLLQSTDNLIDTRVHSGQSLIPLFSCLISQFWLWNVGPHQSPSDKNIPFIGLFKLTYFWLFEVFTVGLAEFWWSLLSLFSISSCTLSIHVWVRCLAYMQAFLQWTLAGHRHRVHIGNIYGKTDLK